MKYALLVLLLCLSVAGYANDAAIKGVGGTITPMEGHPSVRMVREKVDAWIVGHTAKVRCEFVFKNEGPATTVKMGFPEESSGVDVGPIKKSDLKNFTSWVDGKPAKTTFVPTTPDRTSSSETYRAWHVKNVSFKANQTRTVVDEYTSPLGGDSLGGRSFEYILTTGKSWKGKIGEAVVTVDLSEVAGFYEADLRYASKDYIQKGNRIVWSARDFEPSKNIDIRLEPWRVQMDYNPMVVVSDPRLFGEKGIVMARVLELETFKGCKVSWNNVKKECTVVYRGHSLRMKAGSTKATLDGKTITLPVAPRIESSSLHAPIDAVAGKLGMKVTRDNKARRVIISGQAAK